MQAGRSARVRGVKGTGRALQRRIDALCIVRVQDSKPNPVMQEPPPAPVVYVPLPQLQAGDIREKATVCFCGARLLWFYGTPTWQVRQGDSR